MTNTEDKQAELFEHLAELRTRLIRSLIYLVIGTTIAWFLYDSLFVLLTHPMTAILEKQQSKFLLTSFPEAFMIQMQVCIIAGLIITAPLLTLELWGFVSPGLTREEKRPIKWVAPLTVLLFACGVVLCYYILPAGFSWFISYVPKNAELRPSVQGSILFTVKMLFAFGVVFELPVLLMLMAKMGIVDSRFLIKNWRAAMVGVSIVAAVATPSNDAFSMLMMAVPVAVLYFLSIALVRVVEGKRNKY